MLLGRRDDPLPGGGPPRHAMPRARNPASSASSAPAGGGLLCRPTHLRRIPRRSGAGRSADETDVDRLPHADDQRLAPASSCPPASRSRGPQGQSRRRRTAPGGRGRRGVIAIFTAGRPRSERPGPRTAGQERRRVPGRRLAVDERVEIGRLRVRSAEQRRSRHPRRRRRPRGRGRSTARSGAGFDAPADGRGKWTKIGAIMNAATARSSSTIANTRCRLVERSEKPATNRAGATVAPSPMPVSPEPMSVAASLAGTSTGTPRSRPRGTPSRPAAGSGSSVW